MKIVIFDVEPWECETFKILNRDHALGFEEGSLDETVEEFDQAAVATRHSEMNRPLAVRQSLRHAFSGSARR